uniref:Mitochondrial inner membrane protein Mpv17 n=1 Tax=Panagrolaimus superbus TaxID=310955 RepID=A0A914YBW3_9BILA
MEKIVTIIFAGVIGATGDVICQTFIEKRDLKNYDGWRTARFFGLTCFYISPILNRWFHVLERIKGNARYLPLKKVAIDQICFAPFFSASVIYNLRLLEGFGIKESWNKLVTDYLEIYKHSILFWPFVQLINFYCMPLNFRVIFVQLAALIWNTFLSFKTQTKLPIPPLE